MPLTRKTRAYFFTVTNVTRANGTIGGIRFLTTDIPSQVTYQELFDSVPFMSAVADSATDAQQGLVQKATAAQVLAGVDTDPTTGFSLYSAPSTGAYIPRVGSNYIVPNANGTYLENGANLSAALTALSSFTPNGSALSATNRAELLLMPGEYDAATVFTLSAEFVDIIGISRNASDVILKGATHTLVQTAANVRIKNLTLKSTGLITEFAYNPTTNNPLTILDNVIFDVSGASLSMPPSIEYSGVYKNIVINHSSSSSNKSFGSDTSGIASGVFENITINTTSAVPDYSFGGVGGSASGTFTNCKVIGASFVAAFGSLAGTTIGTFTNCHTVAASNDLSFGSSLTSITSASSFTDCSSTALAGESHAFGGASTTIAGTFTRCITKSLVAYSFGRQGNCSGTFIDCRSYATGVNSSFGGEAGGNASGVFRRCSADALTGNYSFGGYGGTVSGTLDQCIATGTSSSMYAFGGSGVCGGTLSNCKATNSGDNYSFGGLGTSSGIFNYCIATSLSGNNFAFGGFYSSAGTASGEYNYCKASTTNGSNYSFGGNVGGLASGKFSYCRSSSTNGDIYSFGGGGGATTSGSFKYCESKSTGASVRSFGSGIGSSFMNCTTDSGGANYSFAGLYDANGKYVNCVAISIYDNVSFGGNSIASGKFINCSAINNTTSSYETKAFGGSGVASGYFKGCTTIAGGRDISFGGQDTASGTFINCSTTAIEDSYSFGGNGGDATGIFKDCTAKGINTCTPFGGGGTATGEFDNISMSWQWSTVFTGVLKNSTIIATIDSGANSHGITDIRTAGRIYNCTILATGTGVSLNSTIAAQTPKVSHSRFNAVYGANVTNGLVTNYNIIDVLIS